MIPHSRKVIIYVCILLGLYSCKKEERTSPQQYNQTNEWIADQMRVYYYWATQIPRNQSLNFNQAPPAFFESIRNKDDRFSWIDKIENLKNNLQGRGRSTGLEFNLYGVGSDRIFGAVIYVVPGSPAEEAGLERGDLFTRVNGQIMTTSNYQETLDPYYKGEGFELSMAHLSENTLYEDDETVSLGVRLLDEPSVFQRNVLSTTSGRKVGYLYYNRFLNSKVEELFEAFNYFKTEGVEDVILDLRYNLGGGIAVSGALSALIGSSYAYDETYVEYQYNAMLNQYFDQQGADERNKSFLDLFTGLSTYPTPNTADSIKNLVQNTRLTLPRVFILATGNSASASELVINNLKPFMEVIHIGGTTMGKNEGSITIDPTDRDFNPEAWDIDWGLQPIVLKLANKDGFGDYHDGLEADYEVDDMPPFAPLGAPEDPLVAKALSIIDPSMDVQARMQQMRRKLFQKWLSPGVSNRRVRPVQVDGTLKLPPRASLQD